ncbi:hypothetical protein H0H81_005062 [Sphagnurus paluster]|uniref:AAA+ ATPase domain-containing protein n=1 Tax=Sphagnurus paluster TaxID=117069 RepID=A0A9P7GMA2_9AGAR|nr:hypothetical protein H0H81_005062 [Sphagnurus paluster]
MEDAFVNFPSGFGTTTARYILHNGPEDPSRSLLIAVGAWSVQLHDEIWVFNEGYWQKNHELWTEIQKGDWKDVILKEDFKKALQKDVYGFFASEKIYKNLSIPWKRGLIMYGPPGNGKTISIKVIMKTCEEQGFTPLYVKSFKSFMGEETAMADVFNHARQMSPCVLILEDLDSLINDQNRSFFLNQIDGLTGNDGLLVIGTTNHFDRLDPGLSSRPSRFDRKFKFDDPDQEERALYAKYWQHKLKDNKEITFPDELVQGIAEATEHFSFAYLKEAFVSSLVELASYDGEDKPTFETLIKCQIKTLRKELGHADVSKLARTSSWLRATNREIPAPAHPVTPYLSNGREGNSVFDSILESMLPRGMRNAQPGPSGEHNRLFVDSVVSDPARIRTKPTGDCLPPSKVVDKNLSGRLKETDRDLVQRMEQLKTSLPGLGQDGAFRYANMLGSSSDGPSRGRRPAALGYGADLA